MEGIGDEYNEHPERPEEPNNGGSFETNEPGGDYSSEPNIPLTPTERSPLDEGQEVMSTTEVLRTFVADLDEDVSAEIEDLVASESVGSEVMPPPVDHGAPFSIEQFSSTNVSEHQANYAAGTIASCAATVYAEYQDEIDKRMLVVDDPDGTILTGFGLRLGYQDERGYASVTLHGANDVNIALAKPGGIVDRYEIKLEEYNGRWVARRTPGVAPNDVSDIHGAVSVEELMGRVAEMSAQDEHYSDQIQQLTRGAPHIISMREARYLESIIAAAEPVGARQDEGEFAVYIERRLTNPYEPNLLQTTWAARQLEQITQRHAERFGPDPVERLYEDRHVTVRATPAAEGQPATISAMTECVVTPGEADEILGRPALSRDNHRMVFTDTVSAADTRIVVTSSAQLFDVLGDEPVTEQTDSYEHGDSTDVGLFSRLLYRPQ